MIQPMTDKAAFRIRDSYSSDGKAKGYKRSYELFDEQLQYVVVHCDQIGNAVLKTQEIITDDGVCWVLEPNRKFMPSLWTLHDGNGQAQWQFRQKAWGKLVNPFHKTLMTVMDGAGCEMMQLVDLHGANLAVVVGLEWGKYALVRGDQPLATLTSLPREEPQKGKGIMGAIRRFISSSDTALVSIDASHPLPGPAVLAMYMLYKEFTDVSAVG